MLHSALQDQKKHTTTTTTTTTINNNLNNNSNTTISSSNNNHNNNGINSSNNAYQTFNKRGVAVAAGGTVGPQPNGQRSRSSSSSISTNTVNNLTSSSNSSNNGNSRRAAAVKGRDGDPELGLPITATTTTPIQITTTSTNKAAVAVGAQHSSGYAAAATTATAATAAATTATLARLKESDRQATPNMHSNNNIINNNNNSNVNNDVEADNASSTRPVVVNINGSDASALRRIGSAGSTASGDGRGQSQQRKNRNSSSSSAKGSSSASSKTQPQQSNPNANANANASTHRQLTRQASEQSRAEPSRHRRQHSTASSGDGKRRDPTMTSSGVKGNHCDRGQGMRTRTHRGGSQQRSGDEEMRQRDPASGDDAKQQQQQQRRRRQRHRQLSAVSSHGDSTSTSSASSCNGSCSSDDGDTNTSNTSTTSSGEPNLPYPGFPEIALKYLTQDTRPRNWCLMLITNPWFERISIIVILLNCITLGMYQPCVDDDCERNRCIILQMFDDIIFAFFALEMSIKMVAMGMYGKNTYLADSWNRLDFFIVLAGLLEYTMHVENLNLTAIRTIRVLRPLRAINRIPSMRILVMLLLDTLPMLGNVLLLCFFVFFIFGIIGVQLWEGILRQRCVLEIPDYIRVPPKGLPDEYRVRVRVNSVSYYYEFSKEQDYICSKPEDSGMHLCSDLPPYRVGPMLCSESAIPMDENLPTNTSCVNWNQYYSLCSQMGLNPFQGTISFDNIGMAWVAIFLVISLEGWTDIMYYVQDAHSFWDWIYFVLLIVIGSFFMINLCLVVIATQFSETKKREMERMRQERARYTSTSTLASSTNNSEPATCYAEIVKYIAHLWRRFKRRMLKKYRLYKYQRQQRKEGLLPNADNLTFSPSRIKCHHPKCPKHSKRKPSNIQDQMITVMVPLNSNNNLSNNNNHNQQYQSHQQQQQQELQQQQRMSNSTTQTPTPTPAPTPTPTPSVMATLTNGTNNGLHHEQPQHQHNSSSENSVQSLENSAAQSTSRSSNLKKSPNLYKNDIETAAMPITTTATPTPTPTTTGSTLQQQQHKSVLLKFPQSLADSEQLISHPCTSGFLSPPTAGSRRPSVMFNEYVLLHTPPATINEPTTTTATQLAERNVCSSEKMTQTGDGSIWQVNLPQTMGTIATNPYADCSELGIHDAMTCQELLAFSVAFSAALPTGQSTLESFYNSLARCDPHTAEAIKNQQNLENTAAIMQQQQQQQQQHHQQQQQHHQQQQQNHQQQQHNHQQHNMITEYKFGNSNGGGGGVTVAASGNTASGNYMEDYSCCYDLYQNALSPLGEHKKKRHSKALNAVITVYRCVSHVCSVVRRYVKRLVEHKNFQQGILLAILINTLSMGIEYHKQPKELTAIVETSNIAFSAIFAVEMLLKLIAEGPFRYIANGFNVFDGVIVILSGIEICQQFLGIGTGGSGLSVLRTFRLLRILKLVRFMPNLRRQLFVMLRTMDNVAVFFSLLVLFIFIFSILGMNLFGCKFCENINGERVCDRKNFDSLLWALVTVFQILTQEDWNVVLFNGMEKTSHWAALYFVALMTFGNYVLFNLLVAILVEGFSSERNERREREQRELVKKLREETLAENYSDVMYDESRSEADSSTTNDSYYEIRNRWHSAEDVRKDTSSEHIIDAKNNMQKQRLLQPTQDYQNINDSTMMMMGGISQAGSRKDVSKLTDEDKRNLKKTYSIRDRRGDMPRLSKIRPLREPPLITTTAATPQDSPNTTLEAGMSFRNWNQHDLEAAASKTQSASSPSLLRPPNIFSGQRSLDEGIPSIDLIPPSPVLAHKPLNILNASQLGSNTSINLVTSSSSRVLPSNLSSSNMHSVIIDDISKHPDSTSASGPIYVPTISSSAAVAMLPTQQSPQSQSPQSQSQPQPAQQPLAADDNSELTPLTVAGRGAADPQQQLPQSSLEVGAGVMQRIPSIKRFRRASSKKNRKSDTAAGGDDDDQPILNNGGDSSCLLRSPGPGSGASPGAGGGARGDIFLYPGSAGGTRSKDTNRLSPQNSIRRLSSSLSVGSGPAAGSRRASACVFNSQLYQNLNQPSKLYPHPSQRRMSSIELAFSKTSQINLHNLEANRKSLSYTNSKIDLDKWQKSYTNLNEPDTMLQQYMEEREKRRNSSCHKRHHNQDKQQQQQQQLLDDKDSLQQQQHSILPNAERVSKLKILFERLQPVYFSKGRETYSLYIFPEDMRFRQICTWFVNQKWFDNVVLLFIAFNCITLAMERPNIPPNSTERLFLATANYVFTVVFTLEMFIKVVAAGMFYGPDAYFTSGWNIMDGSLVTISIIDLLMSLISESSPRIFGILRVFRLLRSLRPLRVINRAPGLKLVVQTLLSSLRPIGNIVLICCTFFIIFGILGVQLFKGTFFYCEGENIKNVRNMTDCLAIPGNAWTNRKYNFDDLGKALMSLFVLSSRDGWVNIMYTGLDAVGVDQQPIVNYNEWRLLYFIAFILLVGFFVLNMFVGVVVENFHRCREEQEKEEKIRRAAKRALQMEKKRRRMHEPPYYTNYSPTRMFVHNVVTSKYFDLAIAAVIGLNVVTMAMEYYMMPVSLQYALKIFNYFFTAVFILEANMKLVALGWHLYLKDNWNQLDVGIVLLSIIGIILEELKTNIIPINPTIIRVMRVLRIARVLKLLKMAKGIRALLDTVMQALPQVGNLGLLFFLLFFIFAALGVELFGRLECSDEIPCQGLGEHAHFANFGMAFLTLFRVATGDNWNGIMKDTLRDNCDDTAECVRNCCVSTVIAPIFFVIFVLMAQFVLVNVVVAVLMKHLEESHKQMEDEMDMEVELERELVREQEFVQEQKLCQQLQEQLQRPQPARPALGKVKSLPNNFTYSTPSLDKKFPTIVSGAGGGTVAGVGVGMGAAIGNGIGTGTGTGIGIGHGHGHGGRRQTIQYFNQPNGIGLTDLGAPLTSQSLLARLGGTDGGSTAAENSFDAKLHIPPLGRRGRRGSTAYRKRGILAKERSLDEQAIRRRNLESKRMSCDSLPWGGDIVDFRSGTIFESLESDGSPSSAYDVRSIRSEEVPRTGGVAVDAASLISTAVISEKAPATATATATTTATAPPLPPPTTLSLHPTTSSGSAVRRPYGRSLSTDQNYLATGFPGPGPSHGLGLEIGWRASLLAVPRSMPPRSRSGSTKQLFKQQALDEDPDMDESSLLLPMVVESNAGGALSVSATSNDQPPMTATTTAALTPTATVPATIVEIGDGLSKSDSAEILRIISERRLVDQRDNSGNEDTDYNELLLVKSPQSSMD